MFSNILPLPPDLEYPPSKTRRWRCVYRCNLLGNSCFCASHWCQSHQDRTWEAKGKRITTSNEEPHSYYLSRVVGHVVQPVRSFTLILYIRLFSFQGFLQLSVPDSGLLHPYVILQNRFTCMLPQDIFVFASWLQHIYILFSYTRVGIVLFFTSSSLSSNICIKLCGISSPKPWN